MKTTTMFGGIALLVLVVTSTEAGTITFNVTGNPNVSGFVQFDALPFYYVSNTTITNLSITAFEAAFTLGDVVTGAQTAIDPSGSIPIIVNGIGLLANNGSQAIAFFPDGFGGTATDGDASLAFSPTPTFGPFTYYQVRWEVAQVTEPSTAALIVAGLAAVIFAEKRKSNRTDRIPAT